MKNRAGARSGTFGTRVLVVSGSPADDAALVADSLVQADLWGHQSHGFLRLPWYAARLRSGAMRAVTDPEVLSDTGPLMLLDGRDGIGQVLADRARELAVERARRFGVGVVGVRNSNHFGTAMYFTRRAAADGCVSILTTNASPAMAPWGGREKVLGTNPWSIAAPGPDGRVVAVDIANTAVARGKIYLAKNRGEPIPETWALSPDGAPTTDAAEGVLGVILPMAGHKGYAITFLMDVLSGALTGSGVGTEVHGPYEAGTPSRCGHLFLALDPAAFGDGAGYEARVEKLDRGGEGRAVGAGLRRGLLPGRGRGPRPGGHPRRRWHLPRRAVARRPAHAGRRDRRAVPGRSRAVMAVLPPTASTESSKADLVHQQLKEEIELGELAPGTPLSELWLVERTGASRTPVREALRRLAAEGLVDLTPRQGARVSRVSLQNVRDLFDFRSMLEPEAIRQATQAAAADPELRRVFADLRTEFARIQRRVPSQARSRAFYELADTFDWAIIGATRNEHLRRTIAELRPHTARLRNLSHVDPQRVEVSVAEHLAICEAMLAGDADGAAARIAEHLAESLRTIFRNLATGPGDGLDLLG